jgi:hypothetical protein
LRPLLIDDYKYTAIVSGKHDTTSIKLVTLGEERLAYIAPARDLRGLDYRANTVAARSICADVKRWCWSQMSDGTSASALRAHCGKFVGTNSTQEDLISRATFVANGVVSLVVSFFRDQDWQEPMIVNNASNSFFTVSRLDSSFHPSKTALDSEWTISEDLGYI